MTSNSLKQRERQVLAFIKQVAAHRPMISFHTMAAYINTLLEKPYRYNSLRI